MGNTEIFSRIDHSVTADEVVLQIENLILEGVLRVGDRLPGERELSARFEVSRPILRNALKELENRGLVIARHGGGTYVADVIGQVFTEPVMELIVKHQKATADYLEYRREIEGITAEMAARRVTSHDRSILDDIMKRMTEAHSVKDFDMEAAIDVEFHNAIGECAHNIILLHTLRSCYKLLADGVFYNRSHIYCFGGAREKLLEQHKSIYQAVVDGDPDRARNAARDHITFIEKSLMDAERSLGWERVSELRLNQRLGKKTKLQKVAV